MLSTYCCRLYVCEDGEKTARCALGTESSELREITRDQQEVARVLGDEEELEQCGHHRQGKAGVGNPRHDIGAHLVVFNNQVTTVTV